MLMTQAIVQEAAERGEGIRAEAMSDAQFEGD
jgi:hypothetical protein